MSAIKGKMTMEGLRSMLTGAWLSSLGLTAYLVPVLIVSTDSAIQAGATVAQFFGASAAAAFGVGKVAEAMKHKGQQ